MNEFVGDERGIVTVEFTTTALANLVETWNRALPYDASGRYTLTLSAEEYEHGKARLLMRIDSREPA